MRPAEVAEVMGRPPLTKAEIAAFTNVFWRGVAGEPPDLPPFRPDYNGVWGDNYTRIIVAFRDGKAIAKGMEVPMSFVEMKLREWLARLRGLVGL
jgi:hypothetical protein